MRITRNQLQDLINEEISRALLLSVNRRLVEGHGFPEDVSVALENTDLDRSIEKLASQVKAVWAAIPEEGDPSMEASGGWETWESQVEAAEEELRRAISEAIDDVEKRLIDGEFYYRRR